MEGFTSRWYKQETGIRQGCPLSPYLFLILMTVIFEDIHEGDPQNLMQHRIQGTSYDEVLYADDTICISTDTKAMNKLLAAIETEGAKYGMKLNRSKCEVLCNASTAQVVFSDRTPVKRVSEATYLGCQLNDKASGQGVRE